MENGDGDSRHGASSSGGRYDDADRPARGPSDGPFPFKEGYTPARAAPAGLPYHAHPSTSPYASSHPHPHPPANSMPPQSMPSMASSDVARRTADESDPHRRNQTPLALPSIQELTDSLPTTSQPLTTASQQRASLYPTAPERGPYARPEPPSAYASSVQPPPPSARPAVPPPPLPLYDAPQPPTPTYPGRDRDANSRQAAEVTPRHSSESYPRYPQQHVPAGQPSRAGYPPGQFPLPPISPHLPHSAHRSSFPLERSPPHPDDDYSRRHSQGTPVPSLEYLDSLNRIAISSQIIYNFAETFDVASREPNSRLPTDGEIASMMDSTAVIQQCLDRVRNVIQTNRVHNERARDLVREPPVRRPLEEEDPRGYGDISQIHQQQHPHHYQHHPPHHPLHPQNVYPLSDAKKRRGVSLEPPAHSAAPRTDPPRKRAAPPGRCHSCNRIDTPEWRRGPDGARTLCNACGLHYAKLERKRQSENRSLRPKP